MYERFGLFVAGEWRASADRSTAAVISPVTEASLGEAPVTLISGTRPSRGDCSIRAIAQMCDQSPVTKARDHGRMPWANRARDRRIKK
jgi:hypothetical protein